VTESAVPPDEYILNCSFDGTGDEGWLRKYFSVKLPDALF